MKRPNWRSYSVEYKQAAVALHTRLALAVLEAAEPGDKVHGLVERRLVLGPWAARDVRAHRQRLPLVRLEYGTGRGGGLRPLATPFGGPEGTPGDDHVDVTEHIIRSFSA